MPVTRSAKKSLKRDKRREKRNKKRKNKAKDLEKKVRSLVSKGEIKQAEEILPQLYKALDKAAKKNVIKENKAARKKSQLAKLVREKEESK